MSAATRQNGIAVISTDERIDGVVSTLAGAAEQLASLHVLLAVANADCYELAVPQGCFDTAPYPGVYLDPMDIDSDGFVHAPKKPGLGFGIDFVEAKKITDQTVVV